MRDRWQISNQLTGLGDLCLRSSSASDERFLQQLFLYCRPQLAEIPLPTEIGDALVRQQYQMQCSSYGKQFPGYLDFLILLHRQPIGRLALHEDNHSGCLQLLDIGFLPEHRGQGHGGTVLRALQALSAQKEWILCLSVDRQNWRAKKWYSALDFQWVRTSETHEELMWCSPVCAS